MAKQVQFRRGTTAQHSTFTGALAEITVDTDKKVVVVHDGSTAGGFPLARADGVVATATTATTANTLNTANAYTGVSFNSITGLSSTTPVMDGVAAVGTGTTAARADHVHATDTSRMSNSQALAITGDVTASSTALNTGTIATTLASVGTAGTYTKVTTDVKGRVTSGTTLSASDIPTLNQDTTGNAATATNLAGGSAGTIPYQTASGTTAMLAAGTAGYVLQSNGTSAPTWVPVSGGGATLSDDTTTSATYYPTFAIATSGTMTTAKVSSTKLQFDPSTGTLNSTIFNSLSDENFKENIETINNGLEVVNKLNGVTFDWKENNKQSSGIIAQELEKILPFLVDQNSNGVKTVNYNGIIGYLINSIKELTVRVEKLEAK